MANQIPPISNTQMEQHLEELVGKVRELVAAELKLEREQVANITLDVWLPQPIFEQFVQQCPGAYVPNYLGPKSPAINLRDERDIGNKTTAWWITLYPEE